MHRNNHGYHFIRLCRVVCVCIGIGSPARQMSPRGRSHYTGKLD